MLSLEASALRAAPAVEMVDVCQRPYTGVPDREVGVGADPHLAGQVHAMPCIN